MDPHRVCVVCSTNAQRIVDTWSVPCLMSLDSGTPGCLRVIIEQAMERKRRESK